ncbi:MAG: DUF4331 domain-containing protein [Solirubrobacterales bacterium]
MKRLSIVAALVAIGVAVPLSIGSSHREAPLTSIDPTADDTDVYAYTAKDAQDALTVVANWVPFEDPAGGPNFYRFDQRARYYINIDNTGDGRYDVRYRFTFKDVYEKGGNSFLYALPPVDSINSPNLLQKQFYNVERLSYGYAKSASSSKNRKHSRKGKSRKGKSKRKHSRKRSKRVLRSARTVARNIPVAPNNVGPKTIPDYNKVANQAITELPGGGKVFAGQRDDPFFVDLGATFDAINIDKPGRPGIGFGNQGGGKDDLAGYGVHSIVLQVPEERVTRDGDEVDEAEDRNAVVGVWASTERRRVSVLASASSRDDDDDRGRDNGDYVQVSRLGNPLVNEVIIPVKDKDRFNSTTPDRDAELYGKYVVMPELAAIMNALFDLKVPETGRADIVLAVLQGIPGLNQHGKDPKPVDTIKVNLGVPPSASEKRLGVLAGDLAGYPNGRRLIDDVVDIDLRVVAGKLANPADFPSLKDACKTATCPNPAGDLLGDGVDQNDKSFLSTFPYLPATDSGFDSRIKRENVPPAP